MADAARNYLTRQFETAWKLIDFDLDGLGTEECLWRPARRGLYMSISAGMYARFLYAVQSKPRSANETSRPPATTK